MSVRRLFCSSLLICLVTAPLGCGDPIDAADDNGSGEPETSGTELGDTGETGETGETGDEREPAPPPPAYDEWVPIELPDTYCSDGSQYKFFVNWHEGADDLMVIFEPGGACWDYESCSGELGKLGAANPNGISDNHMDAWAVHSPLVRRDSSQNPMRDWNMVFVSYCTGDVHTGSRSATYESEDGTKQLAYKHVGHDNMMAVSEWLGWQFQDTDKLYAGGCSAGGAGSNVNYFFLREAIAPNFGYLVNDSGPLFPDSVNSAPLHELIQSAWGLDTVIDETPIAAALTEDFGSINAEMADLFPEDRLAITYFIRDYNYSRYSYERFYEGIDQEGIHQKFWEDTILLMDQYDDRDNLAYFLPYFRNINDSHCASIIDFGLTDVGDWQLGDFIELVLDDSAPMQSFVDPDGSMGPP
ncbi:pectin acetylesterase-family hydrolase [Enhygromyxa salina]|uniref:Pectinacetylesterase n=1 Tax=Enhygromyxa salina TaxID=215803 RepID=A0A2S9YRM9_9BACT|nr:pectin acetylesterase-family hydrolase [Enhygromyxa salina]PRQ07719.1 Pectinacetylesterase [Enhygromyxa salina]